MKQLLLIELAILVAVSAAADAQQPLTIIPLAEKKLSRLPDGELFWRIENFDTPTEAKAVASEFSLIAESAGKVWLFTLGSPGGATPGGTKVKEVGPIPRPTAAEYLLRINEATGPPGSITPVHTHPGSEAFYVLAGEQFVRNSHKSLRVNAGEAEAGCGADIPMQVSSAGKTNLHALVMFVVDANKPFAPPAAFPD